MNERERRLSKYKTGVQYPQVSGFEVLELLDLRSALAGVEEELTPKERKDLEEADQRFLSHARRFYHSVAQVADLAEMRARAEVPPSHWWWYLEELAQINSASGEPVEAETG